MSQEQPDDKEKLKAIFTFSKTRLLEARQECSVREQQLGHEVANRPNGDHTASIASVNQARATVAEANEVWTFVAGIYTGQLIPNSEE